MSGYIKFYRASLEHEVLANDNSAYIVFTKLLLRVDRHTGTYTTGRFKLAELTNLKPSTAWASLQRLKNYKMVTLRSDNKKTLVYICNWSKWQSADDSTDDNKMTTNGQQNDTKQEVRIKNREVAPLANLLLKLNKQNFDFIKKSEPSKSDLLEIDRLIRIDGYDPKLVGAIIKWSAQDSFWSRNILSGVKLRKQFERLLIEAKKSRKVVYNADSN